MFDDVIVPQGVYNWWFYDMGFHSNTSRVLSLSASTRWGDYYNGSRTSYQGAITFKTNAYYSLSTDATYNDITIAQKGFITKEYGGRLTVDFSSRLSTSTFVQWNNQTKEIITNFRLHYIPKIGSDLYLVYNHLLDEEHDFQTIQNTGALKIDYNIRF